VNGLATAKNKLIEFLKMGMTPERLALCIGLGIALGLAPALGTTTLLCTLAAFLFRLNLPAIQLANLFVYPIQLALLIPFIRAGEWLFGVKSQNLSLELIQRMMKADLWETVIGLWSATMRAVMAWLLIAPVIVALVYFVMTLLLKKLRLERLTAAS
jgi:uncharacterized protein (DUF2062 family)